MLTLLSLLAVGFALGMRHAMDADHVLAVTTIVTRERSLRAAAGIGLLWGIGHSLTVFAVGSAILAMGLVIPERFGMAMEFAVGMMLVVLGAMTLWTLWRDMCTGGVVTLPGAMGTHEAHYVGLSARALAGAATGAPARAAVRYGAIAQAGRSGAHAHVHAHGDTMHTHSHRHGGGHGHGEFATVLGRLDRWFGRLTPYQVLRPILIGVVHGLAGSAGVALLVVTGVGDTLRGVAYLAVFGAGTTVGMMAITLLIAAPLATAGGRSAVLGLVLRFAAGWLSLAVGLFLMYRIGYVEGLLGAAATVPALR